MTIRLKYVGDSRRDCASGMSLVEMMLAVTMVAVTLAGAFYAYVQATRMAEWSAMSLAAQSYAVQGIERARAANWYYQTPYLSGTNTGDELPPLLGTNTGPVFTEIDTNYVPQTGSPLLVTNNIYITTNSPLNGGIGPLIRQIQSDAIWKFPYTSTTFTNTAVTLRARDR